MKKIIFYWLFQFGMSSLVTIDAPSKITDSYLTIADYILASKKHELYNEYVKMLIEISDSIISFEEILQDNDVNGLINTNYRLIQEKNESLVEIFYDLMGKLSRNISINYHDSDSYSRYYYLKQMIHNIIIMIYNYDYDYYFYESNQEWIIRKSKLEYYLEKNISMKVDECCEKKIGWIEKTFNKAIEFFAGSDNSTCSKNQQLITL